MGSQGSKWAWLAGVGCIVAVCAVLATAAGGYWIWRQYFADEGGTGVAPPTLSDPVVVATGEIGPQGGVITVDLPGDALDGLSLEVPPGAYDETLLFTISTRTIENHSFGRDVNPITPMISIAGPQEFAASLIALKIPIQIETGEFAMPFAYNWERGALEGVTLIEETVAEVKVVTRELPRNVFLSVIDLDRLTGDIDTGFEHGVHDWQFPNFGSYISQGGHCAGQSIAAMYHYMTTSGATLYDVYDNYDNPFEPTVWTWADDVLAYRLSSVIQESIDWESTHQDFWYFVEFLFDDILVYNAFTYTMMVTGEPQFVGIRSNKGGGHAMIIYRKEGDTFFVSDPNYPVWRAGGHEERTITFNPALGKQGKFEPYFSGPNADDLGKSYERILYFGSRDLIDWNLLDRLWQDFEAGVIGEWEFPDYQLMVEPAAGGVEEELIFGYRTGSRTIRLSVPNAPFYPYLYIYNGDEKFLGEGGGEVEIELDEGDTYLGVAVYAEMLNDKGKLIRRWVNYEWLLVTVDESVEIEVEPTVQPADPLFGVWLADSEGEILVGFKDTILNTATCDLTGWGTNCDETVGERTTLSLLLGPFDSMVEAIDAFCNNYDPSTVYSPPLVGGYKGEFLGGDYWLNNTPACP